jgi:NHLM bacteriocin system ABC transporter peptidase/ATP-binding protein
VHSARAGSAPAAAPLKPGKRAFTRTRLQMEETECGAVALGIVLEHFGTYVPPVTLRGQCGVSRDGSKASNMLRAARLHALEARGFKFEPQGVRDLPMPVIVHWNFNHFVVVEGFKKDRVFLNDPASGRRTVTAEEFDRAFTGVVLTFAPTADFAPTGTRPRLLPSLLERLRGARGAVLFLVLAGLALVIPGLALPVFSQIFVDDVLVGGKKEDWLWPLLIGMGITAVMRTLLTQLQLRYLVRLHMRLAVGMSSSFLWHVLSLPMSFFMARSPGDIATRVHLNDGVAGLLSGRVAGLFLDMILVVFYLALIVFYDPHIAIIAVITGLIHVGLLLAQERGRVDDSLRMAVEGGKMAGVGTGALSMIETIKAMASESAFFARWGGHQAKLAEAQQRTVRRDQLFSVATGGVHRLNALAILGVGALRVMDGQLSLGGLVALQSLVAGFLGPIASLTSFGMAFQQLRGSVERIDDVLGHEPEKSRGQAGPHRRLTGDLLVRGLTFGYAPFSPPLVVGLDLQIRPGQRVALVGSSGSGKSTIAKLVCGLLPPSAGEILFDGEPLASLSPSTFAASVAVVDQQISLFEGTVRDNLTLWDPTVPERELIQAAQDACIHDDIMRLAGGYDASVGEGGFNFSGGQRQRLEIARALVRHPALLIMDEATSALDAETEYRVAENLRRRGSSCLIVAHRLSTIRDCDEILVLHQGRVVERGSHAQLMTEGTSYRQLISAA